MVVGNELEVKILQVDLTEEMKEEATTIALEVVSKCKVERDIAEAIKTHFDKKFSPAWHCIVGKVIINFIIK
jgi:dynein light chain LC8-type